MSTTGNDMAMLTLKVPDHPEIGTLSSELQTELTSHHRGAKVVTADYVVSPPHAMTARMTAWVAVYLAVLGGIVLAVTPWVWTFASHAAAAGSDVTTSFFGGSFDISPDASLILTVVVMALAGCVSIMALTFAARAGHGTLENTYLWWYVLRPVAAAGIGVLAYLAIAAGFLTANAASGTPALLVAAAIGGLAGLFTDQVLALLKGVLRISDPKTPGSKVDSYK